MFTLGVETSSSLGSLALFKNRDLIDMRSWSRSGSHSEFLSASLENLLHDHNFSLRDIARLAIGIGPGSFTGIRVGINFVRALAYARELPVYNLNSLHLLAAQVARDTTVPVRVVQYGFRNLVYTALYRLDLGRVEEVAPPCALSADKLLLLIEEQTLIVGSGFDLLFSLAGAKEKRLLLRNQDFSDDPHAKYFLNTSALDHGLGHLTDWIHTIPLYIRASEAEEKLKTLI